MMVFVCKRNGVVLWWSFSFPPPALSILHRFPSYSVPWKADPSESIFPALFPTSMLRGWTSERGTSRRWRRARGERAGTSSLLSDCSGLPVLTAPLPVHSGSRWPVQFSPCSMHSRAVTWDFRFLLWQSPWVSVSPVSSLNPALAPLWAVPLPPCLVPPALDFVFLSSTCGGSQMCWDVHMQQCTKLKHFIHSTGWCQVCSQLYCPKLPIPFSLGSNCYYLQLKGVCFLIPLMMTCPPVTLRRKYNPWQLFISLKGVRLHAGLFFSELISLNCFKCYSCDLGVSFSSILITLLNRFLVKIIPLWL